MPIANVKSRGYHKIEGASRAFNFDFRNKIVLDIGSSTGGFTEFALNHGAKKVIAIEKGTNQMQAPLRFDPRIELHEKTDIFEVKIIGLPSEGTPQLLRGYSEEPREDGRDERPEEDSPIILNTTIDVILADVSFTSLTKVLAYSKENLSNQNTDFLIMLKPQFEAKPEDLHKGVVKNEKIRREIIKNFELWLKRNDFFIVKKHDNTLTGKTGNRERFYWLRKIK